MPPDTDRTSSSSGSNGGQGLSGAAHSATPKHQGRVLRTALDIHFGDDTDPMLATAPIVDYEKTSPLGRSQAMHAVSRRVLVVSADAQERLHLRACLALARLVWVDEASTTTQARAALADHVHVMVFINLDAAVIDSAELVKEVRQCRPKALVLATTAVQAGAAAQGRWRWVSALQWWWQRRLAKQAGFDDLLPKPLHSSLVAHWAKQVLQAYQKI